MHWNSIRYYASFMVFGIVLVGATPGFGSWQLWALGIAGFWMANEAARMPIWKVGEK
jgi:hypothetical protein